MLPIDPCIAHISFDVRNHVQSINFVAFDAALGLIS